MRILLNEKVTLQEVNGADRFDSGRTYKPHQLRVPILSRDSFHSLLYRHGLDIQPRTNFRGTSPSTVHSRKL
jgi:hypothetical protein